MTESEKLPGSVSSSRRQARKLRVIGSVMLALGVAGAGIVYWLGTRSPDFSGDPSMSGYDKPAERQMEMLYGKQGALIQRWSNDLRKPGVQAFIIIAAATVIAGGCFHFAQLSEDEVELSDESGS